MRAGHAWGQQPAAGSAPRCRRWPAGSAAPSHQAAHAYFLLVWEGCGCGCWQRRIRASAALPALPRQRACPPAPPHTQQNALKRACPPEQLPQLPGQLEAQALLRLLQRLGARAWHGVERAQAWKEGGVSPNQAPDTAPYAHPVAVVVEPFEVLCVAGVLRAFGVCGGSCWHTRSGWPLPCRPRWPAHCLVCQPMDAQVPRHSPAALDTPSYSLLQASASFSNWLAFVSRSSSPAIVVRTFCGRSDSAVCTSDAIVPLMSSAV
jgi:hypothetical protein